MWSADHVHHLYQMKTHDPLSVQDVRKALAAKHEITHVLFMERAWSHSFLIFFGGDLVSVAGKYDVNMSF